MKNYDFDADLALVSMKIKQEPYKKVDAYARNFDLSQEEVEKGLDRLREDASAKIDNYFMPQYLDAQVKQEEAYKKGSNRAFAAGTVFAAGAVATGISAAVLSIPALGVLAGCAATAGVVKFCQAIYRVINQKFTKAQKEMVEKGWENIKKDPIAVVDFCDYNNLDLNLSSVEPFKLNDIIDHRFNKTELRHPQESDRYEIALDEYYENRYIRSEDENA